jgi:signal transduction histidine kinase
MNDSILVMLSNSWKRLSWLKPEETPVTTLTAFVQDFEHEMLSVMTALQANVDLLRDELVLGRMPIDRFMIVYRAIDRLIEDTATLSAVSELANAPRSKQKLMLEELMQDIAAETQTVFNTSQVSLSCNIASGTTIIGNVVPLKVMLTGLVLSVLYKCHKLDTLKIVGSHSKNRVSLSFDSGQDTDDAIFKPWRLGNLRSVPMNGDGISLSMVDAMAKLHDGQLSVSTFSDERQGYRLIFKV